MNGKLKVRSLFRFVFVLLGSHLVLAQEPVGQNAAPPDSTQHLPTSIVEQQQNSRSDHDLSNEIREAIHQDTTLSSKAQKVKVETQNGQVTLRGPVGSEQEKEAIESKAAAIAGQGRVTNELTVKPAS